MSEPQGPIIDGIERIIQWGDAKFVALEQRVTAAEAKAATSLNHAYWLFLAILLCYASSTPIGQAFGMALKAIVTGIVAVVSFVFGTIFRTRAGA